MPELPEVETVARRLRSGQPALIGRTITAVEVAWRRTVATPIVERFSADLVGRQVSAIRRHGKVIMIETKNVEDRDQNTEKAGRSDLKFLLVHLRMSGRLDVLPRSQAFMPHARVVCLLDQDLALCFDDTRKFGRMWLVDDPNEVIGDLGPDALEMRQSDFVTQLRSKKSLLKPVLLDQHLIAGVGNIYADESLHRAGLHPQRPANSLSEAEAVRLHGIVQAVLHEGIQANGASFDWVYRGGNFQNNFRVYGQTGKPCDQCGAPIQRLIVGQRSTHFCAGCQPK